MKISIKGNTVELDLVDNDSSETLESLQWEDRRDLSQRLFKKIECLLQKRKLSLEDIDNFRFDCDSPYFADGKRKELKMEELDSSGKCGFTLWQTGEVITKVLNFAMEN